MIPLALGTGPLGNQYQPVTDQGAVATVEAAIDNGITIFDTAPHYGAGTAERRLGMALAGVPRSLFSVSTKVGRLLVAPQPGKPLAPSPFLEAGTVDRRWDFTRDGILRSLEGSLDRLGLDSVDTVYLHDPDAFWAQASGEGLTTLRELRDQGVVRAIGVGTCETSTALRYVTETDVDRVLIAGRYTLLEHPAPAGALMDVAERGAVAIVAAGVLNSGILADPRPGAMYEYELAPPHLLERAQAIASICAETGAELLAAALQFPLGRPAVSEILVGCRSPAEVLQNARLLRSPVPAATWQVLRERGLLAEAIPSSGI